MTLIKREDALKPFCTAPDGTRIPEVDCDNFPVAFSVEFIKKHLLSLPSVEPHNKDAISREGLLKSWAELSPRGRLEFDQVIMTIPALPSAEAISREEYEDIIKDYRKQYENMNNEIADLEAKLSAEAVQGWIPFTRRPMTEEEQKDYPNCTFMFDCVLPDDGDEILVSNGRFVWMDTFCNDIDGCYLDSGDDIDEDMAWMPLPKPYKGGEK